MSESSDLFGDQPYHCDLICPVCGISVDIYNNDITFSMELHAQKHKDLNEVSKSVDTSVQRAVEAMKINCSAVCSDCGEAIAMYNNDLSLSVQLHAQNHKPTVSEICSEKFELTTTCEKKENRIKLQELKGIDVVDSLPLKLTIHQGFIIVNNNNIVCNICSYRLGHIKDVENHLISTSHNENILHRLKQILPFHLLYCVAPITFKKSELFCNVCQFTLEMNSYNLHETCLNIVAHSTEVTHSCKINSSLINPSTEALQLLDSVGEANELINSNKVFLKSVCTELLCKLCEEKVNFSSDLTVLNEELNEHFISSNHVIKCSEWEGNVCKDFDVKDFAIRNNSLFCTLCNILVVSNVNSMATVLVEGLVFRSVGCHISDATHIHNKGTKNFVSKITQCQNKGGSFPELRCTGDSEEKLLQTRQTSPVLQKLAVSNVNPKVDMRPSENFNWNRLFPSADGNKCADICEIATSRPSAVAGSATNVNKITNDKLNETSCVQKEQHLWGSNSTLQNDSLKVTGTKGQPAEYPPSNDTQLEQVIHRLPSNLWENMKYLADYHNGNAMCKLCNCTLPLSSPNLKSHLEGMRHKKELKKFLAHKGNYSDGMCEILQQRDPVIEQNKKFIKGAGDIDCCTLCDVKFNNAYSVEVYKQNALAHLKGGHHVKKKQFATSTKSLKLPGIYSALMCSVLQEKDKIIQDNKMYIKKHNNSDQCTLCDVPFSHAMSLASYKINVLAHFNGSQHRQRI